MPNAKPSVPSGPPTAAPLPQQPQGLHPLSPFHPDFAQNLSQHVAGLVQQHAQTPSTAPGIAISQAAKLPGNNKQAAQANNPAAKAVALASKVGKGVAKAGGNAIDAITGKSSVEQMRGQQFDKERQQAMQKRKSVTAQKARGY